MRVSLTTHGGLAAAITRQLPPRVADTDQLSPEAAAELLGLLDAVRGDPPGRADPAARDAMTYTIVVEDGPDPATLTGSDAAMTKSFADLLDWVERHAG